MGGGSHVIDEEEDTVEISYVVVVGERVIGPWEGEGADGLATEWATMTFPDEECKVVRLNQPLRV
jgi:hypothetical protein